MKNPFYRIFFGFVLFLQLTAGKAQPTVPAELHSLLMNKTSFYDLKSTINDYYRSMKSITADLIEKRRIDKKLKQWNRYFWWNEHFLTNDGTIENYNKKILEAEELQVREEPDHDKRHQVSSWVSDGPSYTTGSSVADGIGRFDAIAFHPTNANIIYAGSTSGGIFKTTNAGSSWVALAGYLPSLSVAAICVHPTNANIIYAFSGDRNTGDGYLVEEYHYRAESQGVLKTNDGGNTWFAVAPLDTLNFKARDLIMDTNNPSTLFAATTTGIYKTTNSGQSWDRVMTGSFWDMDFKPGSSDTIFAASNRRLFRSIDGGNSFFERYDIPTSRRISLAVTPANPNLVLLLSGGSITSDDVLNGVYRSTNGGGTFTPIYTGADGDLFHNYIGQNNLSGAVSYNNTIAISPTNEDIVLTGGLCIWKSTNGGFNWSQATAYWPGENYVHPDQHLLTYAMDGNIFCANDGGIYKSSNHGTTWTYIENGLSATQFYHFEIENDEGDTWGGTQDNGILERDGTGEGFFMYDFGDGYDVMTDHPWQVSDGESDDVYYTINTSIVTDNHEDISLSGNEDFFGNLGMDPIDEDHIYVGYDDDVFESPDAGQTWNILASVEGNWCIATCKSNADRLYAAGSNSGFARLHRIDSGNETILHNSLVAEGFVNSKITDIEVSTTNSDNVYISSAGFNNGSKVFFSSDAGVSWNNISYNLPNVPVFSLVRDNAAGVYAGTFLGVYYKRSGVSHWEPFYNGLPPVPVSEMELYNYSGGSPQNIMISTFGRGLWKTSTYQTLCPNSVTISGDVEGLYYKDATQIVSSTQEIKPSSGTIVKYNAGDEIRLIPGFHAKGPGIFKTYLTGCGGEIDND